MKGVLTGEALKLFFLAVVFVAMVYQAAVLRGQFTQIWYESASRTYERQIEGVTRGRPNMRVLSSAIAYGVEGLMLAARALVFTHPDRWAGYAKTPWPTDDRQDRLADGPLVPLGVFILFPLIVLAPVLFLVLVWYEAFWVRMAALVLILTAVAGWHPAIIGSFFEAAALVSDWPLSYYLYSAPFVHFDFTRVGAVLLMALYIARRRPKRIWEVAAITAVAPFLIEYMGLLFGVALSIATLLEPANSGWREGARHAGGWLAVTGITALLVAVTTFGVFYALGGQTLAEPGQYTGSLSAIAEQNFTWIRSNVANAITMAGIPLILGGILGGLFGCTTARHSVSTVARNDRNAVLGLFIGYVIVIAIGMFAVPYPSEMGRQLLPLSVVALLLGARAVEYAVNARLGRSRRQRAI